MRLVKIPGVFGTWKTSKTRKKKKKTTCYRFNPHTTLTAELTGMQVRFHDVLPQYSSRSAEGRRRPRRLKWRRWLQSEGRTSTARYHYARSLPAKAERRRDAINIHFKAGLLQFLIFTRDRITNCYMKGAFSDDPWERENYSIQISTYQHASSEVLSIDVPTATLSHTSNAGRSKCALLCPHFNYCVVRHFMTGRLFMLLLKGAIWKWYKHWVLLKWSDDTLYSILFEGTETQKRT